MAECFASGTATFLILGNICTRNCLYCNVEHGQPTTIDEKEIAHLVRAVQKMKLEYIVITSVTRVICLMAALVCLPIVSTSCAKQCLPVKSKC